MFVKVFRYHIQTDKVEDYLRVQEKAAEIYSKYLKSHTIYLNSLTDETEWMEITSYQNEEEYRKSIEQIDGQEEIQELFKTFQSLLVSDKQEILEEEFMQRFVK